MRNYGIGPVSVSCSARTAAIVAEWLEHDFTPREPTLLGDQDLTARDKAATQELARVLRKVARRRRRGEVFELKLPRELASWFVTIRWRDPTQWAAMRAVLPPTTFSFLRLIKTAPDEFADRCHQALEARRRAGRVKARLTLQALKEQVTTDNLARAAERQLKRMARTGSKLPQNQRRAVQNVLEERSSKKRLDPSDARKLRKRLKTEELFEEIRRSGHTLLTWPGWSK